MRLTVPFLGLAAAFALTTAAAAQRDSLAVGDPAPGMEVDWVVGSPVQISAEGVYLVVFPATGRQARDPGESIEVSRLERLIERFGHKGLQVVIISAEAADEIPADLRSIAETRGFTLGSDRRSRTQRNWVRAAGLTELPVAFIVGKAKVMHVGRAGDEDFVNILVQVMTGRYDPALQAEAQSRLDSARRARKVKNWRMATKQYDEVIGLDPQVFAVIALERFEMMLVDMQDETAAYDYVRNQLVGDMFGRDSGALQMLAVQIVMDPALDEVKRDLDLAMTAAKKAVEVAGPRDPDALATLALVHFHRGEYDDAVTNQSRAYFTALPADKPRFKEVLAVYRDAANRAGS